MVSQKPPDMAERAQAIYEQRLRPLLENSHHDQFIAIEPDSGDYFLGATHSEAVAAARKAHPERLSLVLRIGHRATFYIGNSGS